jgi:hypothetical protein
MVYKTKRSFDGNLLNWGANYLQKKKYFCSEKPEKASRKDAKALIL